jgi:hypothetical protein
MNFHFKTHFEMHFNLGLQVKMLFEMKIEIEMQIKMLFPLVAKGRKSHKWPRTAMGVQTKQGRPNNIAATMRGYQAPTLTN